MNACQIQKKPFLSTCFNGWVTILLIAISSVAFSFEDTKPALVSPSSPTPHHLQRSPKDIDFLSINDEIKAVLDREIRPIRDREKRAIELHYLMFASEKWGILYDDKQTYTAQETFDYKRGNCMSMAALYVAAARYVNLPARFQTVVIPENWDKRDNYYVVAGHVNAVIKLPRGTVHIEFLRTFFHYEIENGERKRISDKYALAEFHNNLAMEWVAQENLKQAKAHLDYAIELAPKLDILWSNYGVIDKFENKLAEAEKKYRQAIKLNKKNASAITNLFLLLEHAGRHQESKALARKVERHNKKNPHYLAKLAENAISVQNYALSLELIDKAIKRDDSVAHFYATKAKAQVLSGDANAAIDTLKQSLEKISEEERENLPKYHKKIEKLLSAL